MPVFELQAPDGKVYEVEAEDARAAVEALGKAVGSPDGLNETANAFLGGLIEGVPVVGPYLKAGADRLGAAARSVLNDTKYSDELAFVQGRTKEVARDHPIASTAGNVAGAVAGTLPLVAAAPAAFGAGSAPMLTRALTAGGTGGALGGVDAATRSNFDPSAIATGAVAGGTFGAAGVPLAAGVGRGVGWAADRLRGYLGQPDNALTGLSRRAVDYATGTVSDPARRAEMEAALDRLGPEAMLADVSPEWMGVARGAASRPGQRDLVVQPLLERDAARNARLGADLDRSLGPAPVPSQIDRTIREGQEALASRYAEAFREADRVDTAPIAEALDAQIASLRGPAQRALSQVRQMLNVQGTDNVLDPNAYTLFQTRQAIDGMLASENNPQVIRALSGARQQVDDALAKAVPGVKEIDAQFAELARQRDALGRGQQILDSGRTAPRPQEIAEEITQGALPQGRQVGPSAVPAGVREGARAEIDRVVGTNANDPAALQRLVRSEGDWNRDKLRTVFGRARADDALNAIDREATFYRTAGRVTSGSDTAMASRFGDFLDEAGTPNNIPTDTTITGAVARVLQNAARRVTGASAETRAQRLASELGRLAVARGADRDDLYRGIVRALERKQALGPVRAEAEALARALAAGGAHATQQQLAR